MAVADKTDFRWNGKLSWAVNNLYYDLINVDVAHVPYATTHRNSSFFFKTRLGYISHEHWNKDYEVLDIHIIWDDWCTEENWTAYVLAANSGTRYIYSADITNGCVSSNFVSKKTYSPWDSCPFDKLLATNYVKWKLWMNDDFLKTIDDKKTHTAVNSWVQMNKYTLWTTIWLFSDMNVESWHSEFTGEITEAGNYLLVYQSTNVWEAGFAWQVRLITWTDNSDWVTRIALDAPWLWFKTPKTEDFKEWEAKIVQGNGLKYAVFKDWWEVVGYATNHEIFLFDWDDSYSVYNQTWGESHTHIIWVADANDKIFVLTDNGYVHYSSTWIWHNKFFIQDDMYAGTDKTSIAAYRDMVLAFWRRHIAIWVPNDNTNTYWTMYNQSASIGIWSRYAFTEYDWDLLFISNDKRLLAMQVANNTWRYMLQHEDVWAMLNAKLDTMLVTDDAYLWADDNNLRIFIQTKRHPYVEEDKYHVKYASWGNDMTHIYKFDTKFKVWTEDHLDWMLLRWTEFGVYYWQRWLYVRNLLDWKWWVDWDEDNKHQFETKVSAYMIENENTGIEWQPNLFMLAKLNRLITTLWPWKYTNLSKIHILSYHNWIWVDYEFPIWKEYSSYDSEDWNVWLQQITDMMEWQDVKITECQEDVIQSWQSWHDKSCSWNIFTQAIANEKPWCDSYKELLIQDHSVCINDRIYRLAPTMPLVTSIGESQSYSTQIKIELISNWWDCINFGWWLAELFIAQLWLTWPDGEYLLPAETDCNK